MPQNYSTLVGSKTTPGSIANFVNYAPIQDNADLILQEAQNYIYRSLRHWRMVPPRQIMDRHRPG